MVRREAGGDVGLHLAINRKTRDAEFLRRIRAEENCDAAIGEVFEDDDDFEDCDSEGDEDTEEEEEEEDGDH